MAPFDGRGYPGRRRSVLIAFSAKNKIGFINSVCVEPDLGSKDHPQWSRTNDIITSWLLNSLSKEIGDSAIYSKTAQSLWNSLEHKFGQSNGKKKVAKFLEDQRIIQFLMGLNDSYAQDEGQREVYLSPHYPTDGATFMFTKLGNYQEAVKENVVMGSQKGAEMEVTPNGGTWNIQNQFFSKEQVSELVNLIKQVQIRGAGNTRTEINANDVAGPFNEEGTSFGKLRDGLYLLQPANIKSSFLSNQNVVSIPKGSNSTLVSSLVSLSKVVYANATSDVKDWHVRLGHLPFPVMKKFTFIHFPLNFDYVCIVYPQARQTRIFFPISQIKTCGIFYLIHLDTWGPFKNTTYNGFKYLLTIVDDYNRGTWTFLLSSKSNAFSVLKSFPSLVERQFNKKVKKIRSDNALELGKGTQNPVFYLNMESYMKLLVLLHPSKMEWLKGNIDIFLKLQEP
ncbi:uncharacterized protein [Nicotiana tomentosiformis]|uniref:uncharacterized protein n=1 Tax=Nicotiana tomentosiformis TaxID=4098 RepID=UPI00388CD676